MTSKDDHYDLILVGTSFASSFFLHRYLQLAERRHPRVLVLERGARRSSRWRIENDRQADVPSEEYFVNETPEKHWPFNITFGGTSHAWWACTPRFLPSDFELRSRYGVGDDWPFGYDDLEPFYSDAEWIMGVSGPDPSPFRRSRPYPLPPHLLSDPEKVLQKAYPDAFYPLPCARWSLPLKDPTRPQCCAAGRCNFCPIDAKFTVENTLAHLYEHEGVDLRLRHQVLRVDTRGGIVNGVTFADEATGRIGSATADVVAVGANPIFNATILRHSGFRHPLLGQHLGEQVSMLARVHLDGMESYQGSTSLTAHGYMLYEGDHRRDHAAILMETWNMPHFRLEPRRWREVMYFKCIAETILKEGDTVEVPEASTPEEMRLIRPRTRYRGMGEYAQRAFRGLEAKLAEILRPLPVESIELGGPDPTEGHIVGTTVMGRDPARSVIDERMRLHGHSNLFVLGAGAFVTCPPSNPTLTVAALSLMAAERMSS